MMGQPLTHNMPQHFPQTMVQTMAPNASIPNHPANPMANPPGAFTNPNPRFYPQDNNHHHTNQLALPETRENIEDPYPMGSYQGRSWSANDYRDARRSILSSPPPYSGETSFTAYLAVFEQHIALANVPSQHHRYFLMEAMRNGCREGKAFYNEMVNAGRIANISYDEAVSEAKLFLESGKNVETILNRLEAARQMSAETLESWYDRVCKMRQEAVTHGPKQGVSVAYINRKASRIFLKGLQDTNVSNVLLASGNYPTEMRPLLRKVQESQQSTADIGNTPAEPRTAAARMAMAANSNDIQELKSTVQALVQQVSYLTQNSLPLPGQQDNSSGYRNDYRNDGRNNFRGGFRGGNRNNYRGGYQGRNGYYGGGNRQGSAQANAWGRDDNLPPPQAAPQPQVPANPAPAQQNQAHSQAQAQTQSQATEQSGSQGNF